MTAMEYLDAEWRKIDLRLSDMERRSHWERIIEQCSRLYGHAETGAAIVAHVQGSDMCKTGAAVASNR